MKLQVETLFGGLKKLTPKEAMFEVLDVFENPLPEWDKYKPACTFKHFQDGKLYLIDVIIVDGDDAIQKGIHFLATEIQIDMDKK